MKKYNYIIKTLLLIMISSIFYGPVSAEEVFTIKFATLAPKGTTATQATEGLNTAFYDLEKRFGFRIKVIPYYGGVMGDDPQMIQKAKTGQLDMLATTINGLPLCAKDIDTFAMAYLIEDYGQFDYVMRKNSVTINNHFYKNGWISMGLIITEGQHDLYLSKPYKTLQELKSNVKAANYTGVPDETFFKALGIGQTPVGPTELFPACRAGVVNAGILPSAFVIGMQIYSSLPYIIEPPIRISSSAVLLTKRKWDSTPWDFRLYSAIMQPSMYFFAGSPMRDASFAYTNAMLEYGTKKIKLAPDELKIWKDSVLAYRKKFLENNPEKKKLYDRIIEDIRIYNSTNPIEKEIYLADPTYKNFPDKIQRVLKAINSYVGTGSKADLAKLSDDKIIERWRIYDWVDASEYYIKTGDAGKLKAWLKSYYITEVSDEIFAKHMDSVKRVLGSKEAIKGMLSDFLVIFKANQYTGFQRTGLKKKNQ